MINLLLAATSVDAQIEGFIAVLHKICLLLAILMCIWAAYCFHQHKPVDGLYALLGAFLLAVAVPLARSIMAMGGVI